MVNEADNNKMAAPSEELAAHIQELINFLDIIGAFANSPPWFQYTIPGSLITDTMSGENLLELSEKDFDSLSDYEKGLWIRLHVYLIYHVASVQPVLLSYRYNAIHIMSTYAKDAASQLKNHNYLLAFTALRGVVETIAHFNNTLSTVDNYFDKKEEPKPNTEDPFDTYQNYLVRLAELVIPDLSGSRFKWDRALQAKTLLMTEKQRKKQTLKEKTQAYSEREPVSIMTSIDRLEKSVKGTRSAYDLLCEFVHPNDAQRKLYLDVTNTKMIEGIGLSITYYGAKNAGVQDEIDPRWFISSQIILCIAKLTDVFIERDKRLEQLLNLLKKHTQQYTRQAIKTFSVFVPSDPCPCGSAKPIQSCCGKKLRGHLADPARRQALFESIEDMPYRQV